MRRGVARLQIETVAGNLPDGVITPMMIFTAIGGQSLDFSTKLSIPWFHEYEDIRMTDILYFGRTAAKLDDIVNYIPARISALLMVVSCFLCGKEFDGKRAWYIF